MEYGFYRIAMENNLDFKRIIRGHDEEFCPSPNQDEDEPEYQSLFGPWIRSSEFERKIKELTWTLNRNNPRMSPNNGVNNPVLEAMMRKMRLLQITTSVNQSQDEGGNNT
ncbi:hypothetical protein RYX36_006368 [Vicia faba]